MKTIALGILAVLSLTFFLSLAVCAKRGDEAMESHDGVDKDSKN